MGIPPKRKRPRRLVRPTAWGVRLTVSSLSSGLHLDARGVGPAKGQNKQQSEMQTHRLALLNDIVMSVKGRDLKPAGENEGLTL